MYLSQSSIEGFFEEIIGKLVNFYASNPTHLNAISDSIVSDVYSLTLQYLTPNLFLKIESDEDFVLVYLCECLWNLIRI
jgi:hypothetical protein